MAAPLNLVERRPPGHEVLGPFVVGVGLEGQCATTPPNSNAVRAPDLLDRDFTSDRPDRVWVADFTYVRTWAGFTYVAFIVDVFA